MPHLEDSHILDRRQVRRGNAGEVGVCIWKACPRRPTFEPLFTTQPSATSPWTLLAAMLRGPLSHPICRQTAALCGGFRARFKAHRLCHLVLMCVSSHSTADSRDKLHLTRHHLNHSQNFTIWSHTPRLKYHVHASPQHVATYQFDLPVFKIFRHEWSHFHNFPV